MSTRRDKSISSELLLNAYAAGVFPMAESADDPSLHWVEPRERGIIPLDGLVLTRKLRRLIRGDRFEVTVDADFHGVVAACAAPGEDRETTWISHRIREIYGALHEDGHAHSVEVWDTDGVLAGGLYGVSMAAAFFGESMFHRRTDASKVALAHLVARLKIGGYALLDTQFLTPHLASLGGVSIPQSRYKIMLGVALKGVADFRRASLAGPLNGARVIETLYPDAP
jgi:leucyl/phenylalanyl-tRNA--protein transferase